MQRPITPVFAILVLLGGLVLADQATAQEQVFEVGGHSGYTLTMPGTLILGSSMQLTIRYQNGSLRTMTTEHPKTMRFDFTLTRIDVTAEQAPTWTSHVDGRWGAFETDDGMLVWVDKPAEMVSVGLGSGVQESFDLQELFDLSAIDPGRYRLTASWNEGVSAKTADGVFDLVIQSPGASSPYLQHLIETGNPVEREWAEQQLTDRSRSF